MVKRKGLHRMSFKIVVMSCDKNQDLFEPFHHCMEKYWKDHPEIIYSTETVINPYYKTICRNLPITCWTKRVVETIKDLPCKHILLMVDDIFIREKVHNDYIVRLCDFVQGDFASLNFEASFDSHDIPVAPNILLRNAIGKYKLSCMCQMWQKRIMLKVFNKCYDPWKFEKRNEHMNYLYLISKNGDFIKWGRKLDDYRFGVVQGKWSYETKEFFDQEGIEIDYNKRGFWEK